MQKRFFFMNWKLERQSGSCYIRLNSDRKERNQFLLPPFPSVFPGKGERNGEKNRDENGSDQEKECRREHYAEENRNENEKELAPLSLFFLFRDFVFQSLLCALRACSAHFAGLQYGQAGALWRGTFFRAGAGAGKLCEKAP